MSEIFIGKPPRIGDIVHNGFDIKNYRIVEIYNPDEVGIVEIDEPLSSPRTYLPKIERVRIDTLRKR